jgi:hypothetical protein
MLLIAIRSYDTLGRPWVLEPDAEHLAELLGGAVGNPEEIARRAIAARAAAGGLRLGSDCRALRRANRRIGEAPASAPERAT